MRLKTDNRFHKLEVTMRQVQADVDDMKKVTKRELLNLIQEQANEMQGMSREIKRICETVSAHHADIIRIEKVLDVKFCAPETCAPEPKLKQLDQSVFDGVDPKYITAATNEDGRAFLFPVPKSELEHALGCWFSDYRGDSPRVDGLFDSSDWQNSLIERDKLELTGSDLARAMLARGDKYVSGFGHHHSDAAALDNKLADTVSKHTQCFQSSQNAWDYFVPINNQGEPLTQSEAGL